jgi:hypothetical protein
MLRVLCQTQPTLINMSTKSAAGKGDAPRPYSPKTFGREYDRIFKKKKTPKK